MNLRILSNPHLRLAFIFVIGIVMGGLAFQSAIKLPQWNINLEIGDKLNTASFKPNIEFEVEQNDIMSEPGDIVLPSELNRFFERQDKLFHLLQFDNVVVTREENSIRLVSRSRNISDLGILFWIPFIVGIGSLFISGWIWALRPKNLATNLFVLSGFSICISALSSTIYTTRSLALSSSIFRVLGAFNSWGASLFGMSIIGLFLIYPKPVKRAKFWLVLVFIIFSLWTQLFLLGKLPEWGHLSFIIMTEMFLILVVIILQFILLRKNPTAKASILWIGLSVLLGAGAFVVLNVAPIIFKIPQLDQGIGFSFFLLIYAGIAAGITQYRLFEVEKWAFRFLYYAVGSLFLVLVDALLIYVLDFDHEPAFGIAIFLVSVTYLPLRDSLTRRLFRQSRMGSDETLRIALHVAFAPSSTIRAERWKSSLIEIFNLLQLETVNFKVQIPTIENNGISLLVPSVADIPTLRLSHLDLGRNLFNKQSLKLVEQLLVLIQEAESSRSAYDRGVNEERQRMAQDLHDDLGARLLTGLYEADEKLKPTLQGAIADIRAIVSGMSESKTSLSKLLADLRYETLRRLEASNVVCEWNIVNVRSDDLIIEYELHRTISSIIREITSNVIRHANANRLVAMITIEMNQIFISIEDNGQGMSTDVVNGSKQGHGLKILRKRVASFNGSMEIRSDQTGSGFLIKIPI